MAVIPDTHNTGLTPTQIDTAFSNALTHTPSSSTPAMDGTGAAGTADTFARGDHVHPTDTSRQAALTTAQLAAANSGIDSTKVQQIETNKSNISNAEWTIIEGNYSCTASNVYEYAGISVTCPANQVLEIIAVDRRGAANCTAISIADNDSDITGAETVIAENNAAYSSGIIKPWTRQVVCITPDTRNTAKTYYVWVNRTSTGQNSVRLAYRRIQ